MKIFYEVILRPFLPLFFGIVVATPIHIFLGEIRSGFIDAVPIRLLHDRKPVETKKYETTSYEIVEAKIR